MKSIKTTLILGLGGIFVLLLTQFAAAWWSKESISNQVVDVAHKNTVAFSKINELAIIAQQIRRYEKEYFIYIEGQNKQKRDGYVKEWTDTADKLTATLEAMKQNPEHAFSAADIQQMASWTEAAQFYISEMKGIFSRVDAGENPAMNNGETKTHTPGEVNGLITAGKDRFSGVLIKGVAAMAKEKSAETLALADIAQAGFNRFMLIVGLSVGLCSLIAIFLLTMLPRWVTHPIDLLSKQVDNLSRGKAADKLDPKQMAREFESLSHSIERMAVAQQVLLSRLQRPSGNKPADPA